MYLNNLLRINIYEETKEDFNIYSFKEQIHQLETVDIETTLWVLPNLEINFLDFNDLSLEFEKIIDELNLADKYQIKHDVCGKE